jgi:DNA-binding MarR family transcriptional regulator
MLDMEKGSLTTLIDQLEEMGLVTRCADPRDRRKILISLSASGRDEMNNIMDNYTRNLSTFFHDVKPEESKQFVDSLRFAVEFMTKL